MMIVIIITKISDKKLYIFFFYLEVCKKKNYIEITEITGNDDNALNKVSSLGNVKYLFYVKTII